MKSQPRDFSIDIEGWVVVGILASIVLVQWSVATLLFPVLGWWAWYFFYMNAFLPSAVLLMLLTGICIQVVADFIYQRGLEKHDSQALH